MFHLVAWMMLAGILAVMLIVAVVSGGRAGHYGSTLRWTEFFLFAAGSSLYCVIWIIGCAVKFGDPLHFLKHYAELNAQYFAAGSSLQRIGLYPRAVADTLRGLAPLVVFGIIWCLTRHDEFRARSRGTLGAVALGLTVMIGATISAVPGGDPWRATIAPTAACIPFALAPLRFASRRGDSNRETSREPAAWRAGLIASIVFGMMLASWSLYNHRRVMIASHNVLPADSDAFAVGMWLHRQMMVPEDWTAFAGRAPMRMALAGPNSWREVLEIEYLAGRPNRLRPNEPLTAATIASMHPGECLLTDQPVNDPRFTAVAMMNHYVIYRFNPRGLR